MGRHKGLFVIVIVALGLSLTLAACGPKEPKAEIDINARLLDIYADRSVVRVGEQGAGRKYEILVTDKSEIILDGKKVTLTDLQVGFQIRVWANTLQGGDVKYELLKLEVVDRGDAAPSIR
ncbi:MAG: hypothetical protein V1772_13975 [Chloroflexota bacterium]